MRRRSYDFGNIVDSYKKMVYAIAYDYVRNYDDAYDIAQTSFLNAYQNLDTLRDEDKLPSWLRQITVNACHAFVRNRKPTAPLDPMHAAPDEIELLLSRLAIDQALSCLTDQTRLTVTLFYFGSKSITEIAAFLDIPKSTVKSRLRDARIRLKKEMLDMIESTFEDHSPDNSFVDSVTALIDASVRGRTDDVKVLLDTDASLANSVGEVADEHLEYMRSVDAGGGWSALHLAAHYGNLPIVKLLIEHGAGIEAVSNNSVGNTPLSAAAWGNQLEIVEYLLDQGAKVDAPNGWGATALRRAVDADRPELAKLLISRGADSNKPDNDGASPADAARKRGDDVFNALIKR